MRRPPGWGVTLTIAVLLALACVVVVPPVLHPPLSSADLEGVAGGAEKRIELQQAQAKLRDDVRATLLQAIAGLLLVVGAVATWRQVRISREAQITERFGNAVGQLGSNNEDLQVGGIYTLERVAKDSRRDRQIVQAVLGSYVRRHAPWLVGSPEVPEHPTEKVDRQLPWMEHRHADIQAAMWVLGRRPPSRDEWQLYLSRVDLRVVALAEARLSNAQLRHANLARAYMPEVRLEGADLEDADLREANLQGARLTGASLCKAYLQGADLRQADLRRADLRGANLQGANLQDADCTDVRDDATTVWPNGPQPR
jgi:Pentapeptide repeats (8 copies)